MIFCNSIFNQHSYPVINFLSHLYQYPVSEKKDKIRKSCQSICYTSALGKTAGDCTGHKLGCANAVFTQMPRKSYHKCEIFNHHFLASVGKTSTWCNRVSVYLDTKSSSELSRDGIWDCIIPNKRIRRESIVGGGGGQTGLWHPTSKICVSGPRGLAVCSRCTCDVFTVRFRRQCFNCGPTLQMQNHHCAEISLWNDKRYPSFCQPAMITSRILSNM